ncbi:hypothetical protein CPARA_2gp241 (nucleomorph) [Cryptomonas paramecium]|uniref:Uncharacterized protein n=1 Tax=Cryptomonas paramaecium TaxID=2898 RepID=F2HHV3_9CRYP|nr:hypothetical protein CPARA_2gp241 [Cryptomonas paramecium]AEA38899.1 hypothetical protein CPARA_2gp241 [Cryptomonas paramecium]
MEYKNVFILYILRKLKTQRRIVRLVFIRTTEYRKIKLNVFSWKIKINYVISKFMSLDKNFEIL